MTLPANETIVQSYHHQPMTSQLPLQPAPPTNAMQVLSGNAMQALSTNDAQALSANDTEAPSANDTPAA
jgi:hypothetical protein